MLQRISARAAVLILVVVGASAARKPVRLDEEFDLRAGQKVSIDKKNLTLSFVSVIEDSRCPQGVDCIWAGNATVRITVTRAGGKAEQCDLKTDMEPPEKQVGAYRIDLIKLQPYPKQDVPIKSADYVARLIVRKR